MVVKSKMQGETTMTQDHTYSELIRLKERLEDKAKNLASQLNQVHAQLNSVTTTLALLGHKAQKTEAAEEITLIFPPQQLKGLTHHEALERIARANNNRLKITEARQVLIAAKMISTPKNAYSIISNTIGRVGKFKKIGPGEYELPTSTKEERPLLAEAAHK
jgi:hypothetical protein